MSVEQQRPPLSERILGSDVETFVCRMILISALAGTVLGVPVGLAAVQLDKNESTIDPIQMSPQAPEITINSNERTINQSDLADLLS